MHITTSVLSPTIWRESGDALPLLQINHRCVVEVLSEDKKVNLCLQQILYSKKQNNTL